MAGGFSRRSTTRAPTIRTWRRTFLPRLGWNSASRRWAAEPTRRKRPKRGTKIRTAAEFQLKEFSVAVVGTPRLLSLNPRKHRASKIWKSKDYERKGVSVSICVRVSEQGNIRRRCQGWTSFVPAVGRLFPSNSDQSARSTQAGMCCATVPPRYANL